MFEAECQEEIGKAIPRIAECMKNPQEYLCSAAAEGLSSLGAYRMCPSVFPLLVS